MIHQVILFKRSKCFHENNLLKPLLLRNSFQQFKKI